MIATIATIADMETRLNSFCIFYRSNDLWWLWQIFFYFWTLVKKLTNKQQFTSKYIACFFLASFPSAPNPRAVSRRSRSCNKIIYSRDWIRYANRLKPIAIDNNRWGHEPSVSCDYRLVIDWPIPECNIVTTFILFSEMLRGCCGRLTGHGHNMSQQMLWECCDKCCDRLTGPLKQCCKYGYAMKIASRPHFGTARMSMLLKVPQS